MFQHCVDPNPTGKRANLKWTNTENMLVDCGTKEMSAEHVHGILSECRWSLRYSPDFVKQTIKAKKGGTKPAESLPTIGGPLDSLQFFIICCV